MLFLLIVIINTAISTIQEIHSKKVVDKLSIVASPKAKVIRNGKTEIIDIHQLVLDDIIILKTGEQIAADCKILSNEVEVNESCITGETNTIRKKVGDILLSGSYIVSGNTTAKNRAYRRRKLYCSNLKWCKICKKNKIRNHDLFR